MKSSINNRLTAIRRAVGLGASYLMPRNRRKWVFGGLGNDNNAAYLFIWLNENNRFGIKPVWLGTRDTVKKMRSLGYKAHTRYGLPALWHSLTSGVWLFTSYISELRTYAHGPALLVNLWHGVGIKSIERKISSGPLAEFYAEKSWVHRMNHHDKFKRPDAILSTSPMMTAHFSQCFDVNPQKCIEAGYPRCEILIMSLPEVDAFVEKHFDSALRDNYSRMRSYSHVVFYLPTWRDSGRDFIASGRMDFGRINAIMKEQNAVFVFKPHINTVMPDNLKRQYSNVMFLDPRTELYPLLRLADILVTDYSSVYYDYLLRPDGRTIFFIPDYEEYIGSERDLAFPFDENTSGVKAYSIEEFEKALENRAADAPDTSAVKAKFWTSPEDSNERIVREILNRI